MTSRIKTLFGNWQQPHTADDHALCLFPPPIPLSTINWQQHKYVLTYLSISRYTCLYILLCIESVSKEIKLVPCAKLNVNFKNPEDVWDRSTNILDFSYI